LNILSIIYCKWRPRTVYRKCSMTITDYTKLKMFFN